MTQTTITDYLKAGYPAVAITTSDEDRTVAITASQADGRRVLRIAATGGLTDVLTGEVVDAKASYTSAFAHVSRDGNVQGELVLIVMDFQYAIKNAPAYRALRDSLNGAKARGNLIVLVAPSWTLPSELEHDIPVINDALPTREELDAALNVCMNAVGDLTEENINREAILDAASGLTIAEAEGAIAISYDKAARTFDPAKVLNEKMKLVKQSGYLEVSPAASVSDLGGLNSLRGYIEQEIVPMYRDPDLAVRGVMLVGVPGTGKSLAVRVMGAMLGWPTLRMDLAGLKGSHLGQSEAALRAALRLAEAVSPCVLYLDEVEKALGGHASSAETDGGTVLAMLGILLTWLQEHKSQVITVATCNDMAKLPPELTRAGRFDALFFVDLPSASERLDIAQVHCAKFNVPTTPELLAQIGDLTNEWTGAEIGELIKSAVRRTRRAVTLDALKECAKDIRPIAKFRAEEISALRKMGKSTLRLANTIDQPVAVAGSRRIAKA